MRRGLLIMCLVVFGLGAPARGEIKFEKQEIFVAGNKVIAEIADSQEKQTHGLMFRTELKGDNGMLFIFASESPLAFWMKNTLIPLSIGYFDANKTLIDIQEMVPAVAGELRPKTYPSKGPAQYALEMPKGWFQKKGIKTGARLKYGAKLKF